MRHTRTRGSVPPDGPGLADPLAPFLRQLAPLHKHLCPRQVLGLRMSLHGGELLGLPFPRPDKRVLVIAETDGCVLDGIAVGSGCWPGRRTLRVVDYGKVAATYVDTETGQAVRVWPHPLSRDRAKALVPDARTHWHAQLEGYQRLAATDLLLSEPVLLTFSLAEVLSRPGRRATCAHCREEILNEREILVDGEPVCRSCLEGGYYASVRRPTPPHPGGRQGSGPVV